MSANKFLRQHTIRKSNFNQRSCGEKRSKYAISNQSGNRKPNLLSQIPLVGLLISLVWFSGFFLSPAFAMPGTINAVTGEVRSQLDASSVEGDRTSAFISCLPKELSQPSFKRAWYEMGNGQLERAFNQANPKLNQAEIELKSCMNRQGFTS